MSGNGGLARRACLRVNGREQRVRGDVEQAVQAAFMAEVEPYEIAELSGLPMRRVMAVLGRAEG